MRMQTQISARSKKSHFLQPCQVWEIFPLHNSNLCNKVRLVNSQEAVSSAKFIERHGASYRRSRIGIPPCQAIRYITASSRSVEKERQDSPASRYRMRAHFWRVSACHPARHIPSRLATVRSALLGFDPEDNRTPHGRRFRFLFIGGVWAGAIWKS